MNHYVFFSKPKNPPLTGGDRFHNEVLFSLERSGNEVDYISVGDAPKVFRNFLLFNLRLMWQMRQHARSVFILDFYYHPWSFLAVWPIKYWFNCEVVVSTRGIYFIDKGIAVYWLSRFMAFILLKPADLLIVNSSWTREELCKRGARNKKYIVIPPGVDLPEFKKCPESKNSGKVQLLSVGNCVPVKRIDKLIEAIALLDKEKYHLTIMGETTDDIKYFNKVQRMIISKGLQGNVSFVGFLKGQRKTDAYLKADIFVHSSMAEGYGIVLVEAMYFGLPVVACRVGAIPELIKDKINGFLVPPDDSFEFSQAINVLMEDEKLRKNMGRRNMDDCKELAYSWGQVRKIFMEKVKAGLRKQGE